MSSERQHAVVEIVGALSDSNREGLVRREVEFIATFRELLRVVCQYNSETARSIEALAE